MTSVLDALSAVVAPIESEADFLAAMADPETRWYAQRRARALVAAGLLGATWNPNLHPRGHDGKFIEVFGLVRWFSKDQGWRNGVVTDIDPDNGDIGVRDRHGNYFLFTDPKKLWSRPKPKARMELPDPTGGGAGGHGFTQVGGQGGSNPGGLYQVVDADKVISGGSLDFTAGHKLKPGLKPAADLGQQHSFDTGVVPLADDVAVVPRVDGTAQDRYDVLVRSGNEWYRIPTAGSVLGPDGQPRADLMVTPADAFGQAGSPRAELLAMDDNAFTFQRDPSLSIAGLEQIVRQAASNLPADGDKYYVKKMNLEKRARNEALANDLYELAGIAVPDVSIAANDPNIIASKLIGEKYAFDPTNSNHVIAAQEGFVFDAWLANWDAIGLTYDNIQIGPDGTAWRIDAGGALLYRAQGKPKGQMFGPEVGELDSLRNPAINKQASSVYGGITDAQLKEQATILRAITPAQITALAESYDLPEVGDTLIARRKSILDQLGMDTSPPAPELAVQLPEPEAEVPVYNPLEKNTQPGVAPSAAALADWTVAYNDLPKTKFLTPAGLAEEYVKDSVHVQGNDLWVYQSDFVQASPNIVSFKARSLLSGETGTIYVGLGDEYLSTYTPTNIDGSFALDTLTTKRDLAKAEVVNQSLTYPTISAAMNDYDWKDTLPEGLSPYESTVGSLFNLGTAMEIGAFPQEGGVLRNGSDGQVYEVVKYDPGDGGASPALVLRRSGEQDTITLLPSGFLNSGPWYQAGNDTTEDIYRSRLTPATPDEGASAVDETVKAHLAAEPDVPSWNSVTDDTKDLTPSVPLPEGEGPAEPGAAALEAAEAPGAPTDPVNSQILTEMAPDGGTQAVDPSTHLLASLGPGAPIMAADSSDPGAYEHLVGQGVVVMMKSMFDDPTEEKWYGRAGGIGKVTLVEQNKWGETWLTALSQSGEPIRVKVGVHDKVIVPVTQEVHPGKPTLKKNGDIVKGGTVIGKWYAPYDNPGYSTYRYTAQLNGDSSLTGLPLRTFGNKKGDLVAAINNYSVPVPPKVTKPKKPAVVQTEHDIAALKAKLEAQYTPIVTEQVTQAFTVQTPGEATMGDGTNPVVGQWVYAPKDHTWWKVQTLKPGSKKEQAGNWVTVSAKVDGKTIQRYKKRSELYPVESEGAFPTSIAADKVITLGDGHKAGVGSVIANGNLVITAVQPDGLVKTYAPSTGTSAWIDAKALSGGVSYVDPTVVSVGTEEELQAAITQSLAATVADKMAGALVHDVPAAPPKPTGPGTVKGAVPWPGPNGKLIHQDPKLAEQRLAKGLKVTKDGYAPAVGQVLRHNDGTRYVVVEVPPEWQSNKNSVKVIEAGATSTYGMKTRALSTLVVDHEAMLTDKEGNALPRVGSIDGSQGDFPDGSFIWRRQQQHFVGYSEHAKEPRYATVSTYYVVAPNGNVYDLANGDTVSTWSSQNIWVDGTRVAVLSADGDQKLTISAKEKKTWWDTSIDSFVIHDPEDNAQLTLTGVDPGKPAATPVTPAAPTAHAPTSGTLSNGETVTEGETWAMSDGHKFTVHNVELADDGSVAWVDGATETGQPVTANDATWVAMATKVEAPDPMAVATATPAGILPNGEPVYQGAVYQITGGTQATVETVVLKPGTTTTVNSVWLQPVGGGPGVWVTGDQLANAPLVSVPNGVVNEPDATPEFTLPDGTHLVVGQEITVSATGEKGVITALLQDGTTVAYTPPGGTVPIYIHKDGLANPVGMAAPEVPPPPSPALGEGDADLSSVSLVYGKPVGPELPHPKITSSSTGPTAPQVTGKVGPIDAKPSSVSSTKVRSVMDAVSDAVAKVKANQTDKKQGKWVMTYALADSDLVDDMLMEVSVSRDAKGQDYVETRFRLNNAAAADVRTKLLSTGTTQFGDWERNLIHPKSLLPGDQINVKQQYNDNTLIKPGKPEDPFPNATVTMVPQYMGKSADGKFDIYRTQVAFADGSTAYMDMQDRGDVSVPNYVWNATKERSTTGYASLSGAAMSDGWTVAYNDIGWERAGNGAKTELNADGSKQKATGAFSSMSGQGMTLKRNYDGAEISLQTTGTRHSLDGEVSIVVRADDPQAQAKLSAGLEAVGIPVSKQAPPTARELQQMALNKVAKQFAATYQRGVNTNATPENPASVLALIDKAVGAQLGRKATMDDISLRFGDDGRVQVLLSEDVARAIVKRNGVTHYFSKFTGGSTVDFITGAMAGDTPGIMSSVDRFRQGIHQFGMSSSADHAKESAQRVFMRAAKGGQPGDSSLVVDPVQIHRMVDYYWSPSDVYGYRPADDLGWLTMPGVGSSHTNGGNELMMKRRVETSLWGRVKLSQADLNAVLAKLSARGITTTPDGRPIAALLTSGSLSDKDLLAVLPQEEIPITALVDGSVPAGVPLAATA